MTQLIHELDLMLHIFGQAIDVQATVDTLCEPVESEDTCTATVRFASGALVCCYGTMTSHRPTHGFDVIGERASVHFPWALESTDKSWREHALAGALDMYPDSPFQLAPGTKASSDGQARKLNPHAPYLSAVFDAILKGLPLPVPPEEARAVVEICTAMYASGLTGQRIPLPLNETSRCYGGLTADDYNGRLRLSELEKHQQTAEELPA